jgi:hypothetical protein
VEVVKRDLGRTFNVLLPGLAREREGDDREVEMSAHEPRVSVRDLDDIV